MVGITLIYSNNEQIYYVEAFYYILKTREEINS